MDSQIWHDILGPVGFQFPLHEIVHQHHERNDDSSYPMRLKESTIQVEPLGFPKEIGFDDLPD
jgi:response regulator RpfG family c-di-GMP phosphodiesterase